MGGPKHYYDCGNCKYNWNCGFICTCIAGLRGRLPLPPAEIREKVDTALAEAGFEVNDWEDVR